MEVTDPNRKGYVGFATMQEYSNPTRGVQENEFTNAELNLSRRFTLSKLSGSDVL